MSATASRGMVRSMLIMGSAQAAKILISIAKMKALAVLLGPSGVGLLSLYQSLLDMVRQGAGLGMDKSGVREISVARGAEATLSRVRRVLFAAHLAQGALAMGAVWLLREQIATWLLGDPARALEVGLIGIAILLALMGSAQTALLQGLRRIADLGRVTVLGAFVGTLVGLIAVWFQGLSGLIWFVLIEPLVIVLIARHYASRLPAPTAARLTPAKTWAIWKLMATLGAGFMLGALATTATLLVLRGRIAQELGLEAAGHFAAAWGITMTYMSFLLRAMAADYYPRLSQVITDRPAAIRLINDQAQLSLAIGGPLMLLLIGLAPWVITLLYSAEFGPAVTLLQWQSLGNVFKLASWSLGFALVAAARAKTFLLVQVHFNLLFLLMLWPSLSHFGIVAAGPAFTLAYLAHFGLLYGLVRQALGFRWAGLSLGLIGLHASLALGLLGLALTAPAAAALASVGVAGATGLYGLRIVLVKIGPEGRLAARLGRFYAAIRWPLPPARAA